MSTLKERVIEALLAAFERGHDVADIAKKCHVSVQSVYNWQNAELPIKWMRAESVLGRASRRQERSTAQGVPAQQPLPFDRDCDR